MASSLNSCSQLPLSLNDLTFRGLSAETEGLTRGLQGAGGGEIGLEWPALHGLPGGTGGKNHRRLTGCVAEEMWCTRNEDRKYSFYNILVLGPNDM